MLVSNEKTIRRIETTFSSTLDVLYSEKSTVKSSRQQIRGFKASEIPAQKIFKNIKKGKITSGVKIRRKRNYKGHNLRRRKVFWKMREIYRSWLLC